MITVAPNRAEPFVARASAMPPMPEVAMRLLRALDRDDLSLPELAAIVGRDPALAARVLRLANSARYAPSRRIATLGDAAALLGLRTLRDVALAACLVGSFPKVEGFDRLVFWRGTLALAAYAQTLAQLLGDVDPDTAYVGGLMLRTGQILMLMVDPSMVQRIGRLSSEIDSRMSFERSLLGCNHPEITAELARHWQFPTELVEAFRAAAGRGAAPGQRDLREPRTWPDGLRGAGVDPPGPARTARPRSGVAGGGAAGARRRGRRRARAGALTAARPPARAAVRFRTVRPGPPGSPTDRPSVGAAEAAESR